MKDDDAAWLAAAIDGEGSVLMRRSGTGWKRSVVIYNTDTRFLERARDIAGAGYFVRVPRPAPRKDSYRLVLEARSLEGLAPVLPWMVLKHEQLRLLLEFPSLLVEGRTYNGAGDRYREAIGSLNRKESLAPDLPRPPRSWSWLAAAIDGEGSCVLTKRRRDNGKGWNWRFKVEVCNTDARYLRAAEYHAGQGWVGQDVWHIGSAGLPLMENVLPHLVIKRRQAEILLEVRSLVREHLLYSTNHNDPKVGRLMEELQALNRRGV